jgi:hypothetical protein
MLLSFSTGRAMTRSPSFIGRSASIGLVGTFAFYSLFEIWRRDPSAFLFIAQFYIIVLKHQVPYFGYLFLLRKTILILIEVRESPYIETQGYSPKLLKFRKYVPHRPDSVNFEVYRLSPPLAMPAPPLCFSP